MSAWIEPKTDWKSTDYFNYEDYNRIKGNLMVVKEMADELFVGIPFIDMGLDKVENDLIFAREFNNIENNLFNLNLSTYRIDTTHRAYRDNGLVPDASEYNRIESVTLALHNKLISHKANLYRLPFRLGNQKGMRV